MWAKYPVASQREELQSSSPFAPKNAPCMTSEKIRTIPKEKLYEMTQVTHSDTREFLDPFSTWMRHLVIPCAVSVVGRTETCEVQRKEQCKGLEAIEYWLFEMRCACIQNCLKLQFLARPKYCLMCWCLHSKCIQMHDTTRWCNKMQQDYTRWYEYLQVSLDWWLRWPHPQLRFLSTSKRKTPPGKAMQHEKYEKNMQQQSTASFSLYSSVLLASSVGFM